MFNKVRQKKEVSSIYRETVSSVQIAVKMFGSKLVPLHLRKKHAIKTEIVCLIYEIGQNQWY